MSLFGRLLRCSLVALLGLVTDVCVAQAGGALFLQPQIVATVSQPLAVYSADVNGDGSPDLIYIDNLDTAHILLNNGAGGFTESDELAAAEASIAIGDFNGDGNLDLAWVTYLGVYNSGSSSLPIFEVCLALGDGMGHFHSSASASFTAVGETNNAQFANLAAARLYSSGRDDLVFEDTLAGVLYTFTTNSNNATGGGGSFIVETTTNLANGGGPIAVANLTGGGLNDLVIQAARTGTADVYLYAGSGTFESPVSYSGSRSVHSDLVVDMDGDGHPDLVTEGAAGRIDIYHGNADGSFQTVSEGGSGALNGITGNGGHLAAIGKLGRDTNLDILTATPIGISALLGQGNLTYQLGGIWNAGPGRTSYALADFNGDGNLDLAVDSSEGIAILSGTASSGFQTSRAYAADQPGLSTTLADFNLDGKPDVVVGTGTIQAQLLTGNGDGTFNTFAAPTNTLPSPNPSLWSNVLTGDFNGDGKPDLAYSLTGAPLPAPGPGAGPGLYIQYGNGDGTFAAPIAVTSGSAGASGNNNFYGESATGDFNGDGITDIANVDALYDDTLMGQSSGGPFSLGMNEADGNNTSFNQAAAGFFRVGRSNKQDLVLQEGGNLVPYVNRGDGVHFTRMAALQQAAEAALLVPSAVLIADVDGDGNGDVVGVYHDPVPQGYPSSVCIWYGNGDGTFGAPQTFVNHPRNAYLAAVADMNGDGLPDVLLSDGSIVAVFYNLGNRTFGNLPNQNEEDLLAGQGINSLSVADVNGDGKPDLIVSNGGATVSNAIAVAGASQGVASIALTPNADVNTGGITVLLSAAPSQTVTGSVTVVPNPSPYTQDLYFTVSVAPPPGGAAPTGTVQFAVDGVLYGGLVALLPGLPSTASFGGIDYGYEPTIPPPLPGTHTVTATYSGDVNYLPATFAVTEQVVADSSGESLIGFCLVPSVSCPTAPPIMSVPDPDTNKVNMFYGETYAMNVSNHGTSGSFAIYDFYNGVTTTLCQGSVVPLYVNGTSYPDGGYLGCNPNPGIEYQLGVHLLSAAYFGNADFLSSPAVSPPLGFTVNVLPDITTAAVASSLNPSIYGQAVTFTATITGSPAAPTGQVAFMDGTTVLGTATLAPTNTMVNNEFSSAAAFTTSTLAAGTHPITAVYAATEYFDAATSPVLSQVVAGLPTTAAITSSLNPSTYGQPLTFTASLNGSAAPTGPVVFLDGTTAIGSAMLVPSGSGGPTSTATLTVATLAGGTHSITAVYAETQSFAASTSPAVSQVVSPDTTAAAVISSLNPAPQYQPVSFTATLTGSYAPPTGSVVFLDGATPIVTAALTPSATGLTSTATLATSALPPGTDSITVTYAATQDFDASATTALSQIITPVARDFTITLASPAITLETYRHTTTSVALASLGGFADNVSVQCGSPPAHVTCIFTPNPGALKANGTATVSFYLDTDSILGGDARNDSRAAPFRQLPSPIGFAMLLSPVSLFAVLAARRRSRLGRCDSLRVLLLLAGLALPTMLVLISCGGDIIAPIPSAAPGTYTIPVTATGVSTGTTHTAQLTLTVTP